MSGWRSLAIAAGVAAMAAGLVGCSFEPDPGEARGQATAVFGQLVDALGAVDTAVVRGVEVLPESRQPCEEEGRGQVSLLARGTFSVAAGASAAADVVDALSAELDPEIWSPVPPGDGTFDGRAFASEDGVVVTLTRDWPVLVVAVFPPCAPD